MKISIVRGGGLAGLVTTTTLDTDELPEPQRAEVHAIVRRADLDPAGQRPDDAGPPGDADGGDEGSRRPTQPDRFDYEVVVDDGRARRSRRVREQDAPAALRDLIAAVRAAPQRRQQTRPPA